MDMYNAKIANYLKSITSQENFLSKKSNAIVCSPFSLLSV
jgi:hypothetical protein